MAQSRLQDAARRAILRAYQTKPMETLDLATLDLLAALEADLDADLDFDADEDLDADA